MIDPTAAQRFWKKVDKRGPDECWPWTASANKKGYGMLGIDGASGRPWVAHRVSWTIAHGAIPEGLCVLHRCDTPGCVNPAHLFLGTREDNNKDMARKGRANHPDNTGENNGRSKLTWGLVGRIRKLYEAGHTKADLAERFEVSDVQIGNIVRNKQWVQKRSE